MTLAIIVPVLGRPHQIEPLVASIETNTVVERRIMFVCSPNDPTSDVCRRTGHHVIVTTWKPGPADFAKKINLAYDALTDEDWCFQAATDLTFHPNWDTNALALAAKRHAGVIGTNDLGNPGVMRGQHSTHTFFSRDYIETFGGTVDNTGKVLCELYDHQWCDNEFVQTAKVRRQWTFSRYSIVEHNHPHWGKGEMDSTYKKALRATVADRNLYQSRLAIVNPNSPQARRMRQLAARQQKVLARRQRLQ